MSEFKAMKFWIDDDPELSKKVQKILFELGYEWSISGCTAIHTESLYLTTDEEGYIRRGNTMQVFNESTKEEQNIDWMRTKKVEYVELGGKKYVKEELEEALSKINPVN